MRKVSLIKLFLVFCLTSGLSGCFFDDEGSGNSSINVAGTWRASVIVESCAPQDVCISAGFEQGRTFNAVMNLRQDGSNVEGAYTYEGSGINADVSGRISGQQLTLNGNVQNPFGRATVNLVAASSGSILDAAVSHNVTLFDGRSGTVNGSGDFTR